MCALELRHTHSGVENSVLGKQLGLMRPRTEATASLWLPFTTFLEISCLGAIASAFGGELIRSRCSEEGSTYNEPKRSPQREIKSIMTSACKITGILMRGAQLKGLGVLENLPCCSTDVPQRSAWLQGTISLPNRNCGIAVLSSCSNTCFLPKFVGQKSLIHWTAIKHPQDHSCGSLADLCNVYQTLILGWRMDSIPVCCILVPVTSIFHSEATIVTEPIVPGSSTVAGIPGLPSLNLKLTKAPSIFRL